MLLDVEERPGSDLQSGLGALVRVAGSLLETKAEARDKLLVSTSSYTYSASTSMLPSSSP